MAYFMTSVSQQIPEATVPPLENGDHLDQKTFHERYESMDEDVHAELVGGIVYMASPQKKRHARAQATFAWWLGEYETATAGTEVLVNATDILGPKSEPEPDASQPENAGYQLSETYAPHDSVAVALDAPEPSRWVTTAT